MKAILVIDKNSVDSCLAATMMAHAFKSKGVVESIHVPRHANISIPKDATSVYILGVDLTPYQMVKMLEGTDPNVVVNYRYATTENTTPVADAGVLKVKRYYEITPFTIMSPNTEGPKTQKEHYHDNCVSSMVYDSFLNCTPPVGSVNSPEASDYVRFIRCVRTYFNMAKFEGVFNFQHASGKAAHCADTDIGFFYSNIEALRKAAIDAEPFVPKLRIGRSKSVFDVLQSAKEYALRTNNKIIFTADSLTTEVPCFNVGEEKAFEVMRLVANSNPTVVTYEDLESRRVWRVYSKNPDMVQLLMKTCEMIGSPWSQGKIIYFESEIPATQGKMTVVKNEHHVQSNAYVYTPPKKPAITLATFINKWKKQREEKENQNMVINQIEPTGQVQ